MTDHSQLRDWLTPEFYQKGAFISDYQSDQVLLGKGGTFVLSEEEFSQEECPVFYMKDFFKDEYQAYRPESVIQCSLEDLKAVVKEQSEYKLEITETSNDDHHYPDDFISLKKAFNSKLKKVVLISGETFTVDDPLKAKMKFFARALLFGTGFPYGLWNETYGIVGATPEILFSLKNDELKTFALAGTAKLGLEEELLNSKKDRFEHDLVIQDIEEKLKPFTHSLKRDETEILNFREIIHLKTDIKAQFLPLGKLKALTTSMSPTAALGGYPKLEAMKFLKNTIYTQHHPNRFFGSAMGVTSKSFNQFMVMIRNIQWNEQSFVIESGGGIVPDSDMDKEMNEFRMKRNIIKKHYL